MQRRQDVRGVLNAQRAFLQSLSISDARRSGGGGGGNGVFLICTQSADNDFYGEIRFECKQRGFFFFGPSSPILMERFTSVDGRRWKLGVKILSIYLYLSLSLTHTHSPL